MAFRSDINTLILAALQGGPLHGYEIVRRLKESGGVGKLSEGQIYPYLHQQEADGLLASEWRTDTGGPARRVYSLTSDGAGALDASRAEWQKFASGVESLLSTPKMAWEASLG